MTKREVMQEISDVTNLKYDIVKSVLDTFTDILIRESVMNGVFRWDRAFSINTITRSARKQYNVSKGEYEFFPETEILQIKLSRNINSWHRWKKRYEFNEKHGLTPEDWENRDKELFKELEEEQE